MHKQTYSLTKTQKRVWFNTKLSDNPIPNIVMVFEITGLLDLWALRKAIRHLVDQHSVLKSVIYSSNDYLERVINTAIHGHLDVVDLTQSDKHIDVFWLLYDIAQTKLNLNTGPLFHFHLIKKKVDHFYFTILIHPIIVDRYSIKYLVETLSNYYQAEIEQTDETTKKTKLTVNENIFDFNSIVELEKTFQASEKYRQGLFHWTNTLKSNQFYLNLPKKSFFPTNDYSDSPFFETFLNETIRAKILSFADEQNIDYSIVLLSVYQLLLHKYTSSQDIILNYSTPVSYTDQKVFGCLDNRLPLRIFIDDNTSFENLLHRTQSQLIYDHFYKDVQVNDIVKSIRVHYDSHFSGTFSNTSFDANYLPYDQLRFGSANIHLISKFMKRFVSDSLAIYYRDTGSEISLIADFDDTIDHTAVKNFMKHYEVLLIACLNNPKIDIAKHSLLTDDEYQKILIDWNQTTEVYENDVVHKLFEKQAAQNPHHIAVVYQEHRLSYDALNVKANELAHHLHNHLKTISNQSIDHLIGICLNRGINMVVSMLAVLKTGAGYVPLDPQYPTERLQYMLDDANVHIVLSESCVIERLDFLHDKQRQVIALDADKKILPLESKDNLDLSLNFSKLAYVIYTSGSTGTPKGVMIEHRSVPNLLHTYQKMFLITPKKRVLQFSSMNFDAAVPEIFGTLTAGATLYIVSEDLRQSPDELVKYLEQNHITTAMFPPALLNIMPRHELPSLTSLAFGGDVCDQETIDFWSRNRRFLNVYGPTETTVYATYHIFHQGHLKNCIGKPIPNYTAYVLDKNLNPVPIGVIGELYIGGIGVSRGYINRPEQTAQHFISNPFIQNDANSILHKTGDLVRYLPNGDLEYIGRSNFEVKIRGFRIQLTDIEHVLKNVSNVKQVITKLWDHPALGKVIAAYYVLENYGSTSSRELRHHLITHLPEYMVPGYLIELEEMPVSVNGKINKALLPDPFPHTTEHHIENQEEQILREIWCEVFKLPPHAITTNSDFFELGGHSLLATRLVSRLKEKLKIDIKVKDIFHNSHFKQLSKLLRDSKTKQATQLNLYKAQNAEHYRLSYSQMRLWYFFKMMPECPTYNIVFNIKFSNNAKIFSLKNGLENALRSNEIFRTSCVEREGIPYAKINDFIDFNIPIIECKAKQELEFEIEKEQKRTFDLNQPPLFYCKFLLHEKSEIILILNIHHILFDGGSLDIFMRTLGQMYTDDLQGKTSIPTQLDIEFKDFAYSQYRWMNEGLLTPQLSYWHRKLHTPLPILELPTDFKRPNVIGFSGDVVRFSLPDDLIIQTKKLAATHKCSLFSILLSVYYVLLYKLTHQNDLIVASPIANRTQSELENIIGLCLNIVVYRTQFAPGQTFEKLLKHVNNDVVDVQDNQDLPFDILVDFTQKERDLSRNPVFQTMFILQSGFSMTGVWNDCHVNYDITEENTKTAKFDLTLVLYDRSSNNQISGFFEFNTQLFQRKTITRYTQYFTNILKSVVENTQAVIDSIQFLPLDERRNLLHAWNSTTHSYKPTTIHKVFETFVEIQPNHNAVVCHKTHLTYCQLNEKSNQLARYLRTFYKEKTSKELSNDTLIGICLDRTIETIIAILGVLKAGAAYLPLDPEYPSERLKHILNDSHTQVIISKRNLMPKLADLNIQILNVLYLDEEQSNIISERIDNLDITVQPHNLAYVIYTSGTTGVPKGVMIEHKGVPNLTVASRRMFHIHTESRVLQFASINFDAAVWEIFTALLNGATLYVVSETMRLSPDALAAYIDENAVTFALLPPALLRVMPRVTLPSLQTLAFGGDVCDHETRVYWSKDREFFNAYGPTETTVCATWGLLTSNDPENKIGKPLEQFKCYVLDENLCPVPIGTYGELYIGGVGLARGYLNRTELTVERFIVNPFGDNPIERIYKTGDMVRWLSDGTLEYLGRSDFQVKIRGFRVELGEIEESLNQHPTIKQSVVSTIGENIHKQLVAYYVTNHPQTLSSNELKEYLEHKLPLYMIPQTFIQIEKIPLSANGKIERKLLPKPDALTLHAQNDYLAPRNPFEEALVNIWKDIFKYEKIGIRDNFFALGGNSLLSVRALSAINKKFKRDILLKDFFQHPTIEGIAGYLSGDSLQLCTDMMTLAKNDAKLRVLKHKVIYPTNKTAPKHILLTGANGFLGVHLLHELLTQTNSVISCLIRGSSYTDIHQKMHRALCQFDLAHLLNDSRIHLIKGDLSQKNCGMQDSDWNFISSHCDTIYHNGAYVNHLYDYQMLKHVNVDSTLSLIHLAATYKPKVLHYVSTLSVVDNTQNIGGDNIPDIDPPSDSGYVLTKWVCEHLLISAARMGLKVSILRPGNITGHSQTGNTAFEHNHALLLLKGCLQLGVAPQWSSAFEMTPVDFLSRAIVSLTLNQNENLQIFTLANHHTIRWEDYFNLINHYGFQLTLIPPDEWIQNYVRHLDETNALYPLKEGYLHSHAFQKEESKITDDRTKTQQRLEALGIVYPNSYETQIRIYLDYLIKKGFLNLDGCFTANKTLDIKLGRIDEKKIETQSPT